MVYIQKDGRVDQNGGKVSWRRPVESVKEIFGIFVLFFFSLISPLTQLVSPNQSSVGQSSSGFRSSGGSGSNGSNNRRGGFRSMSDINHPFVGGCGPCSGGSCG